MEELKFDFVLDCSLTISWCFEDEMSEFTDAILDKLKNSRATVPSLWSLEIANVLLYHFPKLKS